MALADDRAELTVVNLSATERREVLVQAGGMGEHEFTEVEVDKERVTVGSKTRGRALPPQTQRPPRAGDEALCPRAESGSAVVSVRGAPGA